MARTILSSTSGVSFESLAIPALQKLGPAPREPLVAREDTSH
jgi:hypothetical protein